LGWGRIQGPIRGDQGFTCCICVQLIVLFKDKCIANPVDGTQILVNEINEVDSGIIETSYDTFSRLTAKLDIDWKKVLICSLESSNDDFFCYLIDVSFNNSYLREIITSNIGVLLVKAFEKRAKSALKLILDNYIYIPDLRKVSTLHLQDDLLEGSKFIVAMHNQNGNLKTRTAHFDENLFKELYAQVQEIPELQVYFQLDLKKLEHHPLSYCITLCSKMVNEKMVGTEFVETTGKDYLDLLEMLFAQPWSHFLVSSEKIISIFPRKFHSKLKSFLYTFDTDRIPSLCTLVKRVIINTTNDIRDLESMDTVPEIIRDLILTNKCP